MDKNKMGAFLASLRAERNMTQQDEAEILCISPQAISKWESGLSIPDVEMLEKLSRFYGVSINEILQGAKMTPVTQVVAASTNDKAGKGTSSKSPMARRLLGRLSPFIVSCSFLVITLLFYFMPMYSVYVSSLGRTLLFSGYNVLAGGVDKPINLCLFLALTLKILIFAMGFGVFFSKKNAFVYKCIQHATMYSLLIPAVVTCCYFGNVGPQIGNFFLVLLYIAYLVLFYLLPQNRKANLKKTYED